MVWSNDAHPFVRESRTFDMMGRLFQDRCMLNDIGVKIKLVRSKDFFYLMGAASKVKIMHVSLFVRKVKLITPSVFLPHAKILEREFTKYPIRRVVCKSFSIPQNHMDVSHEKFSGQLPTRIVIGLVDNRAYNGDLTRNPFNFEHLNLNEIALYLDGQQQHAVLPSSYRYSQTTSSA